MRLPRMTTRRWMIAVAALSLTLGGYREATRLKRNRDEFLARAARHVANETYYRRLVSRSESAVLRKVMMGRDDAAQELASDAQQDTTLERAMERWISPSRGDSTKAEEDDHARFREAQSRADAMAVRARMITDDYRRRQLGYHQRQAEYNAALGRKYAAAAAHPWLAVAPDKPNPN